MVRRHQAERACNGVPQAAGEPPLSCRSDLVQAIERILNDEQGVHLLVQRDVEAGAREVVVGDLNLGAISPLGRQLGHRLGEGDLLQAKRDGFASEVMALLHQWPRTALAQHRGRPT
jgi:hypothetical protein